MPYILVACKVRLQGGPTYVGDHECDKELMRRLNASLHKDLCDVTAEYKTEDAPRVVLNKLEGEGYSVVGATGIGQTCVWTCHKKKSSSDAKENGAIVAERNGENVDIRTNLTENK